MFLSLNSLVLVVLERFMREKNGYPKAYGLLTRR